MKALVVFFSRTGITKRFAEELGVLLSADVEGITEGKGRGGPIGWLSSGREAMSGATLEIESPKNDPSGYDVVVMGTPIWAWNMASPVRSYLMRTKGKLRRVAFFCTYKASSAQPSRVWGRSREPPLLRSR